jgi:hypothetical protein
MVHFYFRAFSLHFLMEESQETPATMAVMEVMSPPPPPPNPSTDSTSDDDTLVPVSEFDFTDYLEKNGLVAVPEGAFKHVDASLDSGVREGMVVEIPVVEPGSRKIFWLATISSVFGPLLKLTYVGGGKGNSVIWHDLSKRKLYPLGWCQMNKIALEPPASVKEAFPNWEAVALQYLEDIQIDTISMHFIDGDGITPAERIKKGMMIEVMDRENPRLFWPATVQENFGGLLKLNLNRSDGVTNPLTVWHFYTSERIFPLNFAFKRGGGCGYFPPRALIRKMDDGKWEDDDIDDFTLGAKVIGHMTNAVPEDLIVPLQSASSHGFEVGELLEFLPEDSRTVDFGEVADIDKAKTAFVVRQGEKCIASHGKASNIFPVGTHTDTSLIPESGRGLADAKKFPPILLASEEGFESGQLCEYFQDGFCQMVSIREVKGSLLYLKLTRDQEVLVPFSSERLFPLGWSLSNGLTCKLRQSLIIHEQQAMEETAPQPEAQKKEEGTPAEEQSGSWCPEIFFNYQCYSASFLSRLRLASLPKSIGPGPVQLVMKEVMSRLIGASYKSASILRRLEAKDGRPRKGYVIETMKGKSRVHDLKGEVEIPTAADHVDAYCRDVCQKLGACPYLVSTILYDKDECPASCNSKPKISGRKGKRGRPPRNRQLQQTDDNVIKDMDMDSSSDESGGGSDPGSSLNSRSASPAPDGEPAAKRKSGRKEWGNILPRSEIRTRGAKLPDYKLHLKIRPTKKEQNEIAINSLRDSIGFGDKRNGKGMNRAMAEYEMAFQQTVGRGRSTTIKLKPAFKLHVAPVELAQQPKGLLALKPKAIRQRLAEQARLFQEQQAAAAAGQRRLSIEEDSGPPPIRQVHLDSNPEFWSSQDTAVFLSRTADCNHLAGFMVEDDVDGRSFMLLNFSTVRDHWSLTLKTAILLCTHIESVKLAHWLQFVAV